MHAPSLDDLARLAASAWESFPQPFRELAGAIVFRIEDFADEDLLNELGIEDSFELTGLYQGVDLTQASLIYPPTTAPIVLLYRRAILDEWIDRGDIALDELIRHVLVHEIGHHFGLSDAQMDAILDQEP